jgi:hypothetical protein
MRLAPLILLAVALVCIPARPAAAADPAAEITAADILDSWRQIERDDRAFAYHGEIVEYHRLAEPVDGQPFPTGKEPDVQVELIKKLKFTVDGNRVRAIVEGQWPHQNKDGVTKMQCVEAAAFDGEQNRSFFTTPGNEVPTVGRVIRKKSPEPSSFLGGSASPITLAHRPAFYLDAMGFNVALATVARHPDGHLELKAPHCADRPGARVQVGSTAPYRPTSLHVRLGGGTLNVELQMHHDPNGAARLVSWKTSHFDRPRHMTRRVVGTVKTFEANPMLNASDFTLDFPVGAHVLGLPTGGEARTYWIQAVDNKLRPLAKEDYRGPP